MEITGYKIREAITDAEFERDALANEFADSQFAFTGTGLRKPDVIMLDYVMAEMRIAALQTLQARYNLAISVDVLGEVITLAEAVKRVGGAGRVAAMWKSALLAQHRLTSGPFGISSRVMEKDAVVAQPTMARDVYLECSRDAAKCAAALRNAIAEGNATVIKLNFDEDLLG